MRRLVLIEIDANGRYCLNTCAHMSIDAKRCNLFDEALTWNYRKKQNGNMRLAACKGADSSKGLV